MSAIDDRIKSIRYANPEYMPIHAHILPAAWMKHKESLLEIVKRHPLVFEGQTGKSKFDEVGGTYVAGEHTDAWGCVWSNVKTGMEAIVTKHPLVTRESVHTLVAPVQDIGFPHGFMYLRCADLRGFEELMFDFAEEPPELQMLIDCVCEYNVRQAKLRVASIRSESEILYFGDDLGMQNGLAIAPELWRRFLKPCYRKIYKPIKNAGHIVYMHTDGYVLDIVPDLIDCGVDVLNLQVRANTLDGLAKACKGKVCIDLDLDRQMFPFCTPEEIHKHVHEAILKLGSPEGGLWLSAEIGDDVPLENVEAIANALEEYRTYYTQLSRIPSNATSSMKEKVLY
jgi:uroporphyrinogen decarboxylase